MGISRRNFIKIAAIGSAGLTLDCASRGLTAGSMGRILGANERVRVGIVGFSDRAISSS